MNKKYLLEKLMDVEWVSFDVRASSLHSELVFACRT